MTQPLLHVALLGDSIFDNRAYVRGGSDVVTHLRRLLPREWGATLCALDGATTRYVEKQLGCVPDEASHLVIAIGGNDALQSTDLLSLRVTSSAQALEAFAARVSDFDQAYRRAIDRALALQRRTAVCTIYNGALGADVARIARMGLALFNDVILRTAIDLGLDALELRSVCTEPDDFVNGIEPSDRGGLKIARAVARLIGGVEDDIRPAQVWGGSR
jgi:hypothetical protein